MCLACRRWSGEALCSACRRLLRRGGDRRLPAGLLVDSAFLHQGPARLLVHRLKYQGVVAAAGPLADAMVPLLPNDTTALVPVPRVWLRRWRFGLDPALALSRELSRRTGLPVMAMLRPPLWAPAHAGKPRAGRAPPSIRPVGGPVLGTLPPGSGPVPSALPGAVLVDDVLTTGATLEAAHRGTGARSAVTATAAPFAGRSTSL